MWKKDIDLVRALHDRYHFAAPLLDAGGQERPNIADYDISVKKAYRLTLKLGSKTRNLVVPHEVQNDRYVALKRPWSFIEPKYLILNPAQDDLPIERLPERYPNAFATVILVSVFEHVNNPYECSDALFRIVKPGGYLFNSTPFLFPYHPSPEDNWRFAPLTLKRIHEKSGFQWLEGDFHIRYRASDGVGDAKDPNEPQPIVGCYALCRKPV
jgi:hypothetical protein